MSPGTTFDPYEVMPFHGYIEQETGRQARYPSLAHFIHSERFRGVDEHYRTYLLRLEDAELFRLEVDGIGQVGGDSQDWSRRKGRLLYAGIFMQAVAHRDRYSQLLSHGARLSVASGSYSDDLARAMGDFISDVSTPQEKLKVAFAGSCVDQGYADGCLKIIFANRLPQCLFAIEHDACAQVISDYARETATAFILLDSSLTEDALAENIGRRSTHIFRFVGGDDDCLSARILAIAEQSGATVSPILPKP
ncbi:hypothetical protein [Pseudomonas savastanoi]|uniref:hypothetical protein n=1 Tax=Pseudomonas savastanoi TaxID=29438 RepID=UPI0013C34D0E|nr:hypothetical protein [Pseudomonas savastanoi]